MALSGQLRVSVAGTPVSLGNQPANCPLMIKALDTNSGVVAVGDAQVSLNSGLRLLPGEAVVLDYVGCFSSLWVNAAVNNEGVAWLVLNA